MQFDPMDYPYASRRMVTYGARGMVATSQQLAAQAGLQILREGGNAVDAAIATAACLTVVEPCSNGIGGDAFALVWVHGGLFGLNGSGPAAQKADAASLWKQGHKAMPRFGWQPVTVPGAPGAWAALSKRFGRMPLAKVLAPAISYARNGFVVSPTVAAAWQKQYQLFSRELDGEEFRFWFHTFAPHGRPPQAGELVQLPEHAETLEELGQTGCESFYRGALAQRIGDFAARFAAPLTAEDLAAFQPEWVHPLRVQYRGYDVWEIPPNGHGLVALSALEILKGFDMTCVESVEWYHRQMEALKLAFADAKAYIAEPKDMQVTAESLLDPAYAEERRKLIGPKAILPIAGNPASGGTVYLAAADAEGMMVSFIQSNYQGFGSGLVVPGTGIALHNRGCNFNLEEGHPNCLAPGKRPYHTIIPGFISKNEQPVGPFGVMGAFMQPQGHLQVVVRAIDQGLNPQAVLDAPRWQWTGGRTIEVEPHFPQHIAAALSRRGHEVRVSMDVASFGRGQIIWRSDSGALAGATESRADGCVAAW